MKGSQTIIGFLGVWTNVILVKKNTLDILAAILIVCMDYNMNTYLIKLITSS